MSIALESFSREMDAAPPNQRARVIKEAMETLPDDQKKAVAVALEPWLPPPDPDTTNRIWMVIIWAFAIALVAAVLVLCIGVFKLPIEDGVKPDMILTIFTTITAFLAGLFSPSPVSKKTSS